MEPRGSWKGFIVGFLEGNQLLSGGLTLLLLGSLMAYAREVPAAIWYQIRMRLVIKLTVIQTDVFYDWLENWMAAQEYSRTCRNLAVSCVKDNGNKDSREIDEVEQSDHGHKKKWETRLTPAPGSHFFWYSRCPVWLQKERERMKEGGHMMGIFEEMTLTFLTRNRTVVRDFLDEVRRFNVPEDDSRLCVYINRWSSWHLLSLVPPRVANTVVLAKDKMSGLIEDIERFYDAKDWYTEHSIPYRRGYLLHGSPGNGKSSAVLALATHFQKDVYICQLGSGVSDAALIDLLLAVPQDVMLLIEDVDQAFSSNDGEKVDNPDGNLTRSGFLNVIDGIVAGTGRVLFMTTNHAERLDDALCRPGRADVRLAIGEPTDRQVNTYLDLFFDDVETREKVKAGLNGQHSMADVQAGIIRHKWGLGDWEQVQDWRSP